MIKEEIDNGKSFEWGRTSVDYGKYRDIYPESLYKRLYDLEVGSSGQKILDLGTGTGVFPRAMYSGDVDFIGIDSSENQIEMAKVISERESKKIKFKHVDSEDIDFIENSFDVITSVQSWHYFDKDILVPKIRSILKPKGKLVIIYMYWLPFEDDLVLASESLILKYNPSWTGGGINRINLSPRPFRDEDFKSKNLITFDAHIPFTTESWLGRIRSSRGVGATLDQEQLKEFDTDHREIIQTMRPKEFSILHQITIEVYE